MRFEPGKKAIAFLILIIIAVKIAYVQKIDASGGFAPPTVYEGDPGHYLLIAKNLAAHNVYTDHGDMPTEFATWRAPFWPFLLSIFFRFTQSIAVVMICKMVVEIALLVWSFVRLQKHFRFSNWWLFGLFALFLEPHFLKYDRTFFTESFTACLLMVLAVLFLTDDSRKKTGHSVSDCRRTDDSESSDHRIFRCDAFRDLSAQKNKITYDSGIAFRKSFRSDRLLVDGSQRNDVP